MTNINFEIERLEGRGITAKVVESGAVYTTYEAFAKASGYADAAVALFTDAEDEKSNSAEKLIGKSVRVLAKGKHGEHGGTIYVVESDDGERFLFGKGGLEIIEKGDGNMTKINLDGMSHVEMIGIIEEIVKRIKRESFSEGYESGYEQAKTDARRIQVNPFKLGECKMETPQQARDRIVEQAKKDVEKENAKRLAEKADEFIYLYTDRIEYVVNRDKRTVVVLFHSATMGVIAKGIAKCAPGDCFNVHIGKAIALRRALGLEVPDEYLNAPQPTEVCVGDEIYDEHYQMSGKVYAINPEYRTCGEDAGYYFGKSKGWLTYIDPRNYERRIERKFVKVTDDSREVSE